MCADVTVNPLSFKLSDILSSYFSELKITGYVPYNIVNKILVLQLIEDIYSGKFGVIIDEDDYRLLSKIAVKFSGCKIIPYDVYMKQVQTPKQMNDRGHRLTEDSLMRFTEDINLRTY